MKKILIVGDSFSALWNKKYTDYMGWPEKLANTLDYEVTNLSQAGVGEYKIFKQLQKCNIDDFDVVVISHTSPYRIHTRKHPIHTNDKLHKDCDLIYSDINYHRFELKYFFNTALRVANAWFVHHYDMAYHEDIYELLRDKITNLIGDIPCIVLCPFEPQTQSGGIDLQSIFKHHHGKINHLDLIGNNKVYKQICQRI